LVGLRDHEFQLIVSHRLAQFSSNQLQIFKGDEFFVIESKELKGTSYFFL
jgi:hypothetical protein